MKGDMFMYQPRRKNIRRDKVVGVRLTETEMEKAKHFAGVSCISLSSWAREIITDYLRMVESEAQKNK